MQRIWAMALVLTGGLCGATCAGDFGATLSQARRVCSLSPARIVAEQDGGVWRLTRLTVGGGVIGDADLQRIGELASLAALDFHSELRVTDEGWRSLTPLSRLRHLALAPRSAVSALKSLPQLARQGSLDFHGCTDLTDEMLAKLSNFRELRGLNLALTGIGDALLTRLGALHSLEELNLAYDYTISDSGLAQLKGLSRLRILTLYEIGPKGEAALRALPRLEELTIQHCTSEAGTIDLSGLVNLKSLDVGIDSIDENGSVRFPGSLRRLGVGGWWVEKPGRLNMGAPLPNSLEGIKIVLTGWSVQYKSPPDLSWLRALRELRELTLVDAPSEAVEEIRGLDHLRVLSLTGGCGLLDDEVIKRVAGLRRLESLLIENCKSITDAGIEALALLTELRRLELGRIVYSRITGAALTCIWKLTGLEVLRLDLPKETSDRSVENAVAGVALLGNLKELSLEGRVTDKALMGLAKLNKLRRLDLGGSRGYTDEGLAGLVNALPELKTVVWNYTPGAAKEPVERSKEGKSTKK